MMDGKSQLLEQLNAPIGDDRSDPTGHGDYKLANLAHSVGCRCSDRRKEMYARYVRRSTTLAQVASEMGCSTSRVWQGVEGVIACKRKSWVPAIQVADKDAAMYLFAALGLMAQPSRKSLKGTG